MRVPWPEDDAVSVFGRTFLMPGLHNGYGYKKADGSVCVAGGKHLQWEAIVVWVRMPCRTCMIGFVQQRRGTTAPGMCAAERVKGLKSCLRQLRKKHNDVEKNAVRFAFFFPMEKYAYWIHRRGRGRNRQIHDCALKRLIQKRLHPPESIADGVLYSASGPQ